MYSGGVSEPLKAQETDRKCVQALHISLFIFNSAVKSNIVRDVSIVCFPSLYRFQYQNLHIGRYRVLIRYQRIKKHFLFQCKILSCRHFFSSVGSLHSPSLLKIVVSIGSTVQLPDFCSRAAKTDFCYVTSIRANLAYCKATGYGFTANKLHDVLADTDTNIFGSIGGIFRYWNSETGTWDLRLNL